MPEIVRAREAFSYNDENGVPVVVTPGKLVSTSDVGYKGREHLFEPVEVRVSTEKAVRSGGRVEDATAAPNEKRSVTSGRVAAAQQKPPVDKAESKAVAQKSQAEATGGLKTTDFPGKGKGDAK